MAAKKKAGGKAGQAQSQSQSQAAPKPKYSYGTTWFPPKGIFEKTLEMQYATLVDLHETVEKASDDDSAGLAGEYAILKKKLQSGDDHLDSVIEDLISLEARTRWSALLHTVATYHHLECEVVVLMHWRLSGMADKEKDKIIRQIHVWDRFKDMSKIQLGTKLSTLHGYDTVNELRCVCNAVKHMGGNISNNLATLKGNGWVKGKPIDPTKLDLKGYREAAVKFLGDLVAGAEADALATFGQPP